MSHLCWLTIFDLQVFLKVAEEANAEEEGTVANLMFKFANSFDPFVGYFGCLLSLFLDPYAALVWPQHVAAKSNYARSKFCKRVRA